ncbi:hypothetical protein SCA6_012160 [Theobroma cacao]
METTPSDEKKTINEPLLITPSLSKGGFRTLPFILANEAFERVATLGLSPNMILYLTREYGMETARAAKVIFIWTAANNFTPILGAFVADSYVGKYRMIGLGSILSFLGMVLLWLTAMFPQARPYCDQFSSICESPTAPQLLFLYFSLGLMSIGTGGIRSSSLVFGADQLNKGINPENAETLQSFFSWYYASVSFSALIAVTGIVYIQDNLGWKMGFGVPVMLMFISALSFYLASSLYVKLKARTSLFTGFAQVLVASFRNRHINLPSQATDEVYCLRKGSRLHMPSEKLRIALPLASKMKGKPVRLGLKQRMGIGILCSCASMVALAIVEYIRREIAIQEGLSDEPQAMVHMSALWLLPYNVLSGLAEAFAGVGQIEFFYAELPKTMSSIGSNLFGLGAFVASLVASFITSAVDDVTKRGGESWVSSNVNKGHYDYYYWLLFGLSILNFMYFLACSKAYGPCRGDDEVQSQATRRGNHERIDEC